MSSSFYGYFFGASILEVEEFGASHYSSARLAQSRVCRALHGGAFAGNRWLRGAGATGKPARDEGHSCGCHAHKTVPLVARAAGSKKNALPRLGCLEVWRGALSHENFLLCEWVENRNTHSHHVFNISGDKFHIWTALGRLAYNARIKQIIHNSTSLPKSASSREMSSDSPSPNLGQARSASTNDFFPHFADVSFFPGENEFVASGTSIT